jgi:hypothetical protein
MTAFARGAPLLVAALAVACADAGGTCPEPSVEGAKKVKDQPYYTFREDDGQADIDYPSHGSNAPKVLTVDREAGVVRVTYEREGRTIVETWAIVGSRFR